MEFDPEQFLNNEVTRPQLAKLDTLRLWNLMEYLQLEAPEDEKTSPCTFYSTILVGCNAEELERQDRLEERLSL